MKIKVKAFKAKEAKTKALASVETKEVLLSPEAVENSVISVVENNLQCDRSDGNLGLCNLNAGNSQVQLEALAIKFQFQASASHRKLFSLQAWASRKWPKSHK